MECQCTEYTTCWNCKASEDANRSMRVEMKRRSNQVEVRLTHIEQALALILGKLGIKEPPCE